jgi:hypothetical protein
MMFHRQTLILLPTEWLQVRYASAGVWLPPCWWRHGFVV